MAAAFPDDENGQILRSIAAQGTDLTVARKVDFAHLFPDERNAASFARRAEALGFQVEVYEPDEESQEDAITEWDAVCSRVMVPSHAEITRTELALAALAREHGGREDGWGFMGD